MGNDYPKYPRDRWRRDLWLRVIAGFKLFNATLLLAAGFATLGLLSSARGPEMMQWAMELAADWQYKALATLATHVAAIDHRTLRLLSVGSFVYSALFYTQGIGLFLGQRWAEYLTIATTAGLIPFEIFEIHRHATLTKVGVLAGNVAIVAYLVWHVAARRERRLSRPAAAVGRRLGPAGIEPE